VDINHNSTTERLFPEEPKTTSKSKTKSPTQLALPLE
jgi:hypothetical protein